MVQAINKAGYDLDSLTTSDINDSIVGSVYDFLLDTKGFAPRTFNKYFSHYTSFISWYSEEFDIPLKNLFEKVPRKRTNPNPEIITQEEYEKLLEVINHQNGVHHYTGKIKSKTNLYKPWLKDAIKLGLMTGRRREELINLKFKNILEDKEGNSFIKIEDYKVNRIQKRKEESNKKFIYIPLTVELKSLLEDLNYEKHKESDTFIIAPDFVLKRNKVMSDTLSRGFSHFYDLLETGRKLTFRSLRKTYITNLSVYMGGNAKSITGHSGDNVLETYYLNKETIAKAANGFQVFAKPIDRVKELAQIRQTTTLKTRNKNQGREVSNSLKKGLEIG